MVLERATGFHLRSKVSGERARLVPLTHSRHSAELELQPDCTGECVVSISTELRRAQETEVSFFVIPPQWQALRAYRGDLHIHTTSSDGRQTLLTMILRARQLGLDFLAVADHNYYSSSRKIRQELNDEDPGLVILPGEEVTVEGNRAHILSINASAPVVDQRRRPEYAREIAALVKSLEGRKLAPGLTPESFAPVLWTVCAIHSVGGKAYLAHPYWKHVGSYHLYRPIYEQLIDEDELDGVELLGDVEYEDNMLSLARYRDAVQRGRAIPIIACSDAHGERHTLGQYYTIVFAPGLEAGALLQAIAEFRSVACQRLPTGELGIFGRFPWVEYAYFLEREYFPAHDDLCRLQADLLRQHLLRPADTSDCQQAVMSSLEQEQKLFWDRGL